MKSCRLLQQRALLSACTHLRPWLQQADHAGLGVAPQPPPPLAHVRPLGLDTRRDMSTKNKYICSALRVLFVVIIGCVIQQNFLLFLSFIFSSPDVWCVFSGLSSAANEMRRGRRALMAAPVLMVNTPTLRRRGIYGV